MPVIRLTADSLAVLRGEKEATLITPPEATERKPKRDHESWEGVDRGLFEALRALRRRLADERSVPPFVIFGDASLREMARVRPGSLEAFFAIVGVGQMKLDEFGDTFVEEIRRYCRDNALTLDAGIGSRPRAKTRTNAKPMSEAVERAFEMFGRADSVAGVARAIERAQSTVAGYLERYVEERRPDSIAPWVDDETYAQVAAALDATDSGFLKPVFDRLEGRISYDVIRLVRAHRTQGGTALQSRA
jgi:ATP-dependent DNA helicase RecQ